MSEILKYWPFYLTVMASSLLFAFNREQPFTVSNQNKRLTFSVTLKNKRESAYNTGIVVDFSENLFFASFSLPVCDETLRLLLPCFLLIDHSMSSELFKEAP